MFRFVLALVVASLLTGEVSACRHRRQKHRHCHSATVQGCNTVQAAPSCSQSGCTLEYKLGNKPSVVVPGVRLTPERKAELGL